MASKTPRKTTPNTPSGTPKTGLPNFVSPPVSSRLRSRNRKPTQAEESESRTPLARKRAMTTPSKTQPVKRVTEEVASSIQTPKTATRRRAKGVFTEKSVSSTPDEQPKTPQLTSPPLVKRLRSCNRKSNPEPVGLPETHENESESESEAGSEDEPSEEREQSPDSAPESEEEQNEPVGEAAEEEAENSGNEQQEAKQEEESDSDSDSDDDAPEAVSLSSGKSMALQAKKQEREAAQRVADQQRQKRREIDSKLKEQKAAKKDRVAKKSLPKIEIEEEVVPQPLEIPATLPLDMLEMVADMDEELPKKRNHIKMDEFEGLSDDEVEPKSKRVKGEKSFGSIKVVSLTSQPKAKHIPESVLDFKSKHFFGTRVNRKSSVLNMSQRRNVAVKFRRA
ncbi:hypothetical protein K493DRAFT_409494 [Basidiobolus meristosporus CBS 931.73]|uniref:Uncharacterized protein n=1 Tax=Basidiobolus meristosporus CBS 931.73 TaxID=1314790 RepID=A0A1Y1VSA6_9FUNG|nr:hypothetical protein K493DRAFT_322055 [Basidiobolus meristosporus CBS 931.73]ORX91116.1 hypothetical protein K493DRAFT_409494 [Basidiobolus meristosporus CBS 931.73]|eukprot:ORX63925.1 hypothetical protein K493DRAFT_322055 [Basidiobolus meristosporus CBS 931.73]